MLISFFCVFLPMSFAGGSSESKNIGKTVRVRQHVISGKPDNPRENRNFDVCLIATGDASINNRVENENDLGLSGLAFLSENARRVNPNTLLLDAGNFAYGIGLYDDSSQDSASSSYYAVSLAKKLGYNAMNIGRYDMSYGGKILMNISDDASISSEQSKEQVFFVSQNVKAGDNITDKFKIFNVNGFKIAVIGVTWNVKAEDNSESMFDLTAEIDFKNLQIDINSLDKVVDYIVLLSNMRTDDEMTRMYPSIQMLMENIKNVDLIVNCDPTIRGKCQDVVKDIEENDVPMVMPGSGFSDAMMVRFHVVQGSQIGDISVKRVCKDTLRSDDLYSRF